MKYHAIKNKNNEETIFFSFCDSFKDCVKEALEKGISLRYADLSHVKLSDVDFTGADLRDSLLNCSDLKYAYLEKADLRGADLRYTELYAAELQGAKLKKDVIVSDVDSPAFIIGPIGIKEEIITAIKTNTGIQVLCSAFGDLIPIEDCEKSKNEELIAACRLIRIHFNEY